MWSRQCCPDSPALRPRAVSCGRCSPSLPRALRRCTSLVSRPKHPAPSGAIESAVCNNATMPMSHRRLGARTLESGSCRHAARPSPRDPHGWPGRLPARDNVGAGPTETSYPFRDQLGATAAIEHRVCRLFVEEAMSQRILGARVFLNGIRRRHRLRDTLSRVKQGGTMRLGEVLAALDIDDVEFRNDLAQIEATNLEVVVRPVVPPDTPKPPDASTPSRGPNHPKPPGNPTSVKSSTI